MGLDASRAERIIAVRSLGLPVDHALQTFAEEVVAHLLGHDVDARTPTDPSSRPEAFVVWRARREPDAQVFDTDLDLAPDPTRTVRNDRQHAEDVAADPRLSRQARHTHPHCAGALEGAGRRGLSFGSSRALALRVREPARKKRGGRDQPKAGEALKELIRKQKRHTAVKHFSKLLSKPTAARDRLQNLALGILPISNFPDACILDPRIPSLEGVISILIPECCVCSLSAYTRSRENDLEIPRKRHSMKDLGTLYREELKAMMRGRFAWLGAEV